MPAAADTCLCLTRACAAGSFVPRRLAGDHRRERSNRACPGWASPGTACAAGAAAQLSACSSAPQACSRAGSHAALRLRLPCRDAAAEPDGSAPQARARSPAGYAVLRRRLAIPTVRAAARVPAPQAPPRRLAACCHCVSPRTRATHWAQARRRRSAGAVPGNTGRWAGGRRLARPLATSSSSCGSADGGGASERPAHHAKQCARAQRRIIISWRSRWVPYELAMS